MCQEHGLSVIAPGDAKGKSYVEHRAEQTGTSYKVNLKRKIDQLIPVSSDLEDLLRRLQAEGYEIRRGKNLSCKVAEQKYFTHLKSLGIDYTEEAIAHRIAGGLRPSKQPKKQGNRISLLIDIQNNLKAQESAGFAHWAKINNLKQAAKTMNYLTEHQIDSYEELRLRLDTATEQRDQLVASIKNLERQIAELAHIQKQAEIYRQYQPVYVKYQKVRDKEKFLRGHESDVILFEAATREMKRMKLSEYPDDDQTSRKKDQLEIALAQVHREYQRRSNIIRDLQVIQQNVDLLLAVHKETKDTAQEIEIR